MHPELLLRIAADRRRDDLNRAEHAHRRAVTQAHPAVFWQTPGWSRPPAPRLALVPPVVIPARSSAH